MSEPDHPRSFSAALDPEALRAALVPQRPVFANPWDSTEDMFACYFAVAFFDPLLLWAGGKLMGAIFGFGTHWAQGVFMLAALVGAGGFMTIVGRERTSLSVDIVAISAWIVLGLIVAPIVGLAPPTVVAVIIYAVMLAAIFGYVFLLGQWEKAFIKTLTWPVTWSLLAIGFAFTAYHLILFQ